MAIKIARKDRIVSGYNGHLESVIVYDNAGVNQVETTNGVFVVVEGLMEGQREVKKARLASEADVLAGKKVYFIHNAEVMYDERLDKLEDFVIKAGKVARAYSLTDGDIITLTADLYTEAVAVGDELVADANGLLGKVADTTGAKQIFEVIEDCGNELHHTAKAFAVQVRA